VKFEIKEEHKPVALLLSGKFNHAKELQERSLVPHPLMLEIPSEWRSTSPT